MHEATIADVLDQPVYGGHDYEDGGQEGAVQCEDCCGMYVTGLCNGRPSFDSGKFHNHCVECPDFGQCIGDYREQHCMDCGKHWFAGMSGFACTHCGGGRGGGRKSKPLSELPPPPLSAFDGVLVGAADKIREQLPSMNPFKRMMVESLLAGAGYAGPEAPQEAAGASGSTSGGGSSRLTPDVGSDDVMMGLMAAMAGGAAAEGLPALPPELREQMAENPEAMMALFSMMMGGMPGDGDEDEDDEGAEVPPPRKASKAAGKAGRKAEDAAKRPRRGGGGGGSSGNGGGVSAEFAY